MPVDILCNEKCIETYGEEICANSYFATMSTEPESSGPPTWGAPLLCAENGSVSYRGMLSKVHENGHLELTKNDYHLLAMADWQEWAKNGLE